MKRKTIVVHRNMPHDVYIGRPSKWGNPYIVGKDGTRKEVIAKYEKHLLQHPELMNALHELKGKRIACWCKPMACHGDVLAKYADKI
jgi:hypothetical protein